MTKKYVTGDQDMIEKEDLTLARSLFDNKLISFARNKV